MTRRKYVEKNCAIIHFNPRRYKHPQDEKETAGQVWRHFFHLSVVGPWKTKLYRRGDITAGWGLWVGVCGGRS